MSVFTVIHSATITTRLKSGHRFDDRLSIEADCCRNYYTGRSFRFRCDEELLAISTRTRKVSTHILTLTSIDIVLGLSQQTET